MVELIIIIKLFVLIELKKLDLLLLTSFPNVVILPFFAQDDCVGTD